MVRAVTRYLERKAGILGCGLRPQGAGRCRECGRAVGRTEPLAHIVRDRAEHLRHLRPRLLARRSRTPAPPSAPTPRPPPRPSRPSTCAPQSSGKILQMYCFRPSQELLRHFTHFTRFQHPTKVRNHAPSTCGASASTRSTCGPQVICWGLSFCSECTI